MKVSTLNDSKNFSTHFRVTLLVLNMFPEIRAIQRTLIHVHLTLQTQAETINVWKEQNSLFQAQGEDSRFLTFVVFWWRFWLQTTPQNFSRTFWSHSGYLTCSTRSGLRSTRWFVAIRCVKRKLEPKKCEKGKIRFFKLKIEPQNASFLAFFGELFDFKWH